MTALEEIVINMSPKKLAKIIKDPVKTAEAANLVYVHDTAPGIMRKKYLKNLHT